MSRLEYFPHSRESGPVSIAQFIWRGIEETCCGGTLSPSSLDKRARQDIQQRMESPLPSLSRQSRISHTHSHTLLHTLSQGSAEGSTHGGRSTEESEMTTPPSYRGTLFLHNVRAV
eukprot:Blabericola_migrator_1__4564@NODE_2428_length_2779_cov_24_416667_g1174_i2_p1_GENE_NODE_2428_length_2779_cov_24_416667_g1174_i2NODE_2428_length_2779_cov_24_416667_g1174_i2_p1_ORF_typecomplete_len116_score22_29_NODE_2428_length_2779_cov_24_416667_g1174_i2354701